MVPLIGWAADVGSQTCEAGGYGNVSRHRLADEGSLIPHAFPKRGHGMAATRQREYTLCDRYRTGNSRPVKFVIAPRGGQRGRNHGHGAGLVYLRESLPAVDRAAPAYFATGFWPRLSADFRHGACT